MANATYFSPDGGTTRYPLEDTTAREGVATNFQLMRDGEVIEGKNLNLGKVVQGNINISGEYNPDNANVVCETEYIPVTAGANYVFSGATSITGETLKFINHYYSADYTNLGMDSDWINSGTEFTVPSNSGNTKYLRVSIRVATDNTPITPSNVSNIMLCTQAEWNKSQTYEPFYIPVKDSKLDIVDQQVVGAWNLLQNTAVTQVVNDVTYTVNSDKSITLNGTASANSTLDITSTGNANIKALSGTFVVSIGKALPAGCIISIHKSDSTQFMITSPDTSVEITVSANDLSGRINFFIPSGTQINNVTVYPMISLQPNTPYTPWCMTNRELTNAVALKDITSQITWDSDVNSHAGVIYKENNIIIIQAEVYFKSATGTSWKDICTFPDKFKTNVGFSGVARTGTPIVLTTDNYKIKMISPNTSIPLNTAIMFSAVLILE